MTDDQKIEQAAMAIREVVVDRSKHSQTPWAALPATLQQYFRDEAKAALRSVGAIK